jgi:hypothetical protein
MRVVFDDQQHGLAGPQVGAIVDDVLAGGRGSVVALDTAGTGTRGAARSTSRTLSAAPR